MSTRCSDSVCSLHRKPQTLKSTYVTLVFLTNGTRYFTTKKAMGL